MILVEFLFFFLSTLYLGMYKKVGINDILKRWFFFFENEHFTILFFWQCKNISQKILLGNPILVNVGSF
jgi:hypothetical protein